MKNWKDKVLGMFAIIGVMALLMGNYLQKPKISVGITQNKKVAVPRSIPTRGGSC